MEIKDVTNFELDVIEASRKNPVLVDFWAPWCGPCKVLGPVLEKLAAENESDWELIKVNVDDYQDLAQQFEVRGIPTVKLFVDGEVINEFSGALSEPQLRKWIDENVPNEITDKLKEIESSLIFENPEKAQSELQQILKNNPQHAKAAYLMAKLVLFSDPSQAKQYVDMCAKDPEMVDQVYSMQKISAVLDLYQHPEQLEQHPVKEIFMEGAKGLLQQNFDLALQKFIEVVMKYKEYHNQLAREACIAIFRYLGEGHEISKKYRRRFDMALY